MTCPSCGQPMADHKVKEPEPDLTPTQDLLMAVLSARWRLGENVWTFDARHRNQLKRLQSMDLVFLMHGIVEKTVRAGLTDRGKRLYIDPKYKPKEIR